MWSFARMAGYVKKVRYLQQLKENDEVLSQALEKGSYLIFCKNKPYLKRKDEENPFQSVINWRTFQETQIFNPDVRKLSIVLDVTEDSLTPLFACAVSPELEKEIQEKHEGFFTDMRRALFSVSDEHHQLITRGYSLITWNDSAKFCCHCGAALERHLSGCSKTCKECKPTKTHYPQIHPIAIIRVLNHSQDKLLLVRKPEHPKGMYSCIAGFMEPGEILQDNIRREIAEESGIIVENIQYFRSEAWPLPQISLMLACTAVAMPGSENIEIDKSELEDGRWFSKEEVLQAIERVRKNPGILRDNQKGEFLIPPHGAVANSLIRNWVGKYTPKQL